MRQSRLFRRLLLTLVAVGLALSPIAVPSQMAAMPAFELGMEMPCCADDAVALHCKMACPLSAACAADYAPSGSVPVAIGLALSALVDPNPLANDVDRDSSSNRPHSPPPRV